MKRLLLVSPYLLGSLAFPACVPDAEAVTLQSDATSRSKRPKNTVPMGAFHSLKRLDEDSVEVTLVGDQKFTLSGKDAATLEQDLAKLASKERGWGVKPTFGISSKVANCGTATLVLQAVPGGLDILASYTIAQNFGDTVWSRWWVAYTPHAHLPSAFMWLGGTDIQTWNPVFGQTGGVVKGRKVQAATRFIPGRGSGTGWKASVKTGSYVATTSGSLCFVIPSAVVAYEK